MTALIIEFGQFSVKGWTEGRRSIHGLSVVTSLRLQHKLDKRERIRAAAHALFVERGFDATTTKEVAARAGVAAGTVFLYAKDKADLLFLVMHERLASAVDARFATLGKGPLLERLLHVFAGIFAMYGEHPAVAAAFVRELPGAKGPNADQVNALTVAFLHRLAGLVREAQDGGEVDPSIDPLRAATNVFSLYFGALLGWIGGFTTLEVALDPGLRGALALQIRGFSPR